MSLTIPQLLQGVGTPEAFLAAIQKEPSVGYNHWLTTIQLVSDMTAEGSKLQADNANLQAVVAELETQNASFAAEITTLKTVIAEIKDLSAKQASISSLQTRLSPKHPDPDKFNGNKDDLLQFTTQLKLKLNINADYFAAPKSDIAYAISRLEGNASVKSFPSLSLPPRSTLTLSPPSSRFSRLRLVIRTRRVQRKERSDLSDKQIVHSTSTSPTSNATLSTPAMMRKQNLPRSLKVYHKNLRVCWFA